MQSASQADTPVRAEPSQARGDRGARGLQRPYRSAVDREAMARRQRQRLVAEALEDERGRETALAARLEEVVAESDGPHVDERAFARMEPDDVALVRTALETPSLFEEEDDPELAGFEDDTPEEDDVDEEIARLEGEIAESQRLQRAYERYLEALEG
jgi:hypothetical protein